MAEKLCWSLDRLTDGEKRKYGIPVDERPVITDTELRVIRLKRELDILRQE